MSLGKEWENFSPEPWLPYGVQPQMGQNVLDLGPDGLVDV